MKTNTGKYLALIALTCSIGGCKSDPPAAPALAPSAPTAAAAPASNNVITPGKYEVCDVGDTKKHGDLERDHLTGKKVEIKRIYADEATLVCIGEDGCPDNLSDPEYGGTVLWMVGDQKRLRAVHSFEHEDTHRHTKSSEAHLVQIRKDPTDTPPAACTKANVLILRVCHPHTEPTPTSQWQCEGSDAPHGADAHIQN
jgi:hypothetical protein